MCGKLPAPMVVTLCVYADVGGVTLSDLVCGALGGGGGGPS